MKRHVALAILGMTAIAASNAFGQGVVQFNNYASPYVPITSGGVNVGVGDGVQIQLWAAPGLGQPEGALAFVANADISGAFPGYTDPTQTFTLPGAGADWTLQLRATGNYLGQGVVDALSVGPLINTSAVVSGSPPPVPNYVYTPGFQVVVPEPTTFALAGLGAAALLIFRRRD